MKTNTIVFSLLVAALNFSLAGETEAFKAPNGGRLVKSVTPTAEFVVNKEKKIEIRFLEGGKIVAPAQQIVTVTMGDRAAPTKLTFTADGDKLVSDKAIPKGDNLPVVLQIKSNADAKAVNEKFNLNLGNCPTCSNHEYACACDHSAGGEKHKHHDSEGHEGHDH